MSTVLVTGANGFVGRVLCERLRSAGHEVRTAIRDASRATPGESVVVGDIGPDTVWEPALRNVEAVIHLAARVHVLHDSPDNERLYFMTNTAGTHRLAQCASDAGVRRLVLLSSIKVNGEGDDGRIYRADDAPAPVDAYGRSKLAAEGHAFDVARTGRLAVAVLRVPLVHGPGVRANFLRLVRWVAERRPLPLGAVDNRRSLIGLDNLCDLLTLLMEHPSAAGQVWLGSDGEDLSTSDLIRRLARALGTSPRLLPVPERVLRLLGRVTGRSAEIARLCGSLQVDSGPAREILGWQPPRSVDEGLAQVANWYLAEKAADEH